MGIFSKKDKATEAALDQKKESSPPPSYQAVDDSNGHVADLSAVFGNLRLGQSTATTTESPSKHECMVHLKFLTALAQLREDVSETDGLWGITDGLADSITHTSSQPRENTLIKIREKRWAVYVTRAVERFQKWWHLCVPSTPIGTGQNGTLSMTDILEHKQPDVLKVSPMQWTEEMMPPLDVLMVLHSFMLNPRDYLEDCIRFSKLGAWRAGMPWNEINNCIDNNTFDYSASASAKDAFESRTGYSWENLQDPTDHSIDCFRCKQSMKGSITEPVLGGSSDTAFGDARGFADKSFAFVCPNCRATTTHDVLRLMKFRGDMENLLKYNTPMPGTILSLKGLAEQPAKEKSTHHDLFFSNWLIQLVLKTRLLELTDKDHIEGSHMEDIRDEIEKAIRSTTTLKAMKDKGMKNPRTHVVLLGSERVSVRRMMSRYWENSSPFALDLVGAVLRQGIFVDKMSKLDWIHSPALESTVSRLLGKYEIFFRIMAENAGHMAVPTLDVDLAWHTHQLSPGQYYHYSQIMMQDEYVDHNDKIDENKLSENFAWTSKMYQKMTNGGIYSECTCWYCEAIRESTFSLFSSTSNNAKKNALSLHDDPRISSDPHANPHISAHNAVKATSHAASMIASSQKYKLDADYARAVKRAKKNGKQPPHRDDYVYAYAWGYPMFMPIGYMPYGADPCVSGGAMYANNPSCMNTSVGAAGNCAMGSCGGNAAQGSCGFGGGGASACGGGVGSCGSGASAGMMGGMVGGACAGGGGGGGACGGGGGGCGGGGGGGC